MAFISMQPNLGRRSLPTLLALSMIRIKRHLISTFVRWFACSLCLVAMTCQAADAWTIDDIAVLTDPSGIETIEGVSQASRSGEFKPFPHGFSAGYTRSVHWIRFTLQAPPETPQGKRAVLLEIQPAYLDDLTFYLSHPTRKDGSFQVARSGSNEPHSAKAFPYRAFAFLVEFKDAEPRVAYIRVQTVNGAFLTIKAWKPKEFIDQTSLEYMLFGALMGVFLTGLAANVWQGLWRTESLYRCFMGFSISYLTYTLTTNGFVGQFILPDSTGWIKHWFSLGVFTAIIFGTRFYMLALDIAHAPVWMQWLYRIQLLIGVLCLPASFFDLYPEVARIVLPSTAITLIVGTFRSIRLWRRQHRNAKVLLVAHMFSLVGTLSIIPVLLGWLPGENWLLYAHEFGPIGTLLALQIMLANRVKDLQSAINNATLETAIARSTAQQERDGHNQQRHFLSMLTHELKTPLSVIRMRMGAASPTPRMQRHATQAVQDIDAIVERCALVSKIDEKADTLRPLACRIDELLSEVIAQQHMAPRIAPRYAEGATNLSLHTDPVLLRTIMSNLIDNARKYSPPDGRIAVEIGRESHGDSEGVHIKIQNAVGSAGMPDLTRVFEKYYRAPGARLQSGSGLGLYIVKALTEQLGGTVRCRPQAHLLNFELWLPLQPAPPR